MALDHALALVLPPGEAVLRLYAWEAPTASFGRNEPAVGRYAREEAEARGVEFVRRPTGGRVVLHDAEVTYTVVAPQGALGGPRLAYRRINEALGAALRALGASVGLSDATGVPALDAGPCFQEPAEGEVVARGRKLVGSAQARIDGALLQHGSILLGDSQAVLDELRPRQDPGGPGVSGGSGRPATLSALLPDVGFRAVSDAVADQMQKTFDGSWRTDDYRQAERDTADRLEAERYGTHAWTWRR